MNQASIEEAHAAFKADIEATLKTAERWRCALEQFGRRGSRWAKEGAETVGTMNILLYKCLRLIGTLIEENRKLRVESMQTKKLNAELSRTHFHQVAKSHLN